jgi:hypothetical protein
MIAGALAFLLTEHLTDFINAINTVASILLGFGFSVLFFIASSKIEVEDSSDSLEKKNRVSRLNQLSKELFHNVSYFVLTSFAALASSMLVIAPEAHGDWFATHALPIMKKWISNPSAYVWWLNFTVRAAFFFLIVEAGYTFARIVNRVNFLFEEKLKD